MQRHWPEQELVRLAEMNGSGASPAQIAAELGRTRNAVIGKLDRLKEKRRRARPSRAKPRKKPVVVEPPKPEALPLDRLENNNCRWPLWADDDPPNASERFYCGGSTLGVIEGHPYCVEHARLAFRVRSADDGRHGRPYIPGLVNFKRAV